MWLAENEDVKFFFDVLTELQNRGVKNTLTACSGSLKGFT